ncbi:MAG: UDP-galactopyranose mutase [Coriobacteriaceae bacterium]|nr:UDP-galactopyranose mutase [Coriobacteriaceae bacterium]
MIPVPDVVIVGAGFAGSVVARELAQRADKTVLVIEKRRHIGGNAYDHLDAAGVLVHDYGPHIFHTESQRVFEYLSRYTSWRDYQHQVVANIHGRYIPVPFNLNSIELSFDHYKAQQLVTRLIETYGEGRKVPIIELRDQADPLLTELADYVYENVFLGYTKKQWGVTPEEVDPSVTARVPVLVGRDNRYFQDTWQGMPLNGYTALFEALLDHHNITVCTGTDARQLLRFETNGKTGEDGPFTNILFNDKPFNGEVIYTGALDQLCEHRFGILPYRSLDFEFKTLPVKHILPCGTVNYTVSEEYTRITEFTWLTGQDLDVTTIMEEYPCGYEALPGQIPYYAIINEENNRHYQRYLALFSELANFHVVGRLAEYRYYNMDHIVKRALELADELC